MMKLIPKDASFFDLLEASARRAHDASLLLERLLAGEADAWKRCKELREAGHTDEGLTLQLMDKLNRTFITPIDREDIHDLAFKLDDVTGSILVAADRVAIYQVSGQPGHAETLLIQLVMACASIRDAIGLLRAPKQFKDTLSLCRNVQRIGNQADEAMRAALEELFARPVTAPTDVLEVIKRKEVFDFLKKAIDACEEVADLVHGVVVKNA